MGKPTKKAKMSRKDKQTPEQLARKDGNVSRSSKGKYQSVAEMERHRRRLKDAPHPGWVWEDDVSKTKM